jgi:A/G-specific adenine glycosylase
LNRVVLVVESQGQILVRKGEKGRVMADLYEFPYFDGKELAYDKFGQLLGFKVEYVRHLKEIVHTFTRYKAHLFPCLLKTANPGSFAGAIWISRERLLDLPFSAGHRKILRQL